MIWVNIYDVTLDRLKRLLKLDVQIPRSMKIIESSKIFSQPSKRVYNQNIINFLNFLFPDVSPNNCWLHGWVKTFSYGGVWEFKFFRSKGQHNIATKTPHDDEENEFDISLYKIQTIRRINHYTTFTKIKNLKKNMIS